MLKKDETKIPMETNTEQLDDSSRMAETADRENLKVPLYKSDIL